MTIPAEMVETSTSPPRRPGRLLRRVAAYSATRGITEGFLGIRSVLLASLLGPAGFGGWALLRLGARYAPFAGLGIYRGLELHLLSSSSEPDAKGRNPMTSASLGFVLTVSGTLAFAALAGSFMVRDRQLALVLRGFAASSVAEAVYWYAMVCTRVQTDLRRYAVLEMTNAGIQMIAAVTFAFFWGLAGAFAGLALANITTVAIASRWVELRPSLRLEPLRRLLGVGVPVVLSMMLATALSTGDRWLVAAFGGATTLGYYAFAASVAGLAGSFGWVIRTVVFPDVYGQAKLAGAASAVRDHLEGAVLPFARLYPPLLGALAFAIGPSVALAMPRYAEAIGPARIFLVSGSAVGLINILTVGVVAAGRQRTLPILSAIALLLNLTLSVAALQGGIGLAAVAGASLAAQTFYATALLILAVRESRIPEGGQLLIRSLFPLIWCTGVVLALGYFVPGHDLRSAALGIALYLVMLLPLVPGIRSEWRKVRG